MYHTNVYTCDKCGDENELDFGFSPGKCHCGGTYQQTGECYDQEFVDQERYEREQDYEYEQRHRYDY